MRVFLATIGQDTGGQGYRIKQAFDRLAPEHQVRSMATKRSFIAYPLDMPSDLEVMKREYNAADVVHHRNNLATYGILDRNQGKPGIVHHQGTAYRTRSFFLDSVCRAIGAAQCVSTIDLELIHGHPWLPTPYDLDEMADIAQEALKDKRDGKVIISHAPTNRAIKSTQKVIAAVKKLQLHGYPVELDLIEGRPWEECLARKARSDIYVDQLLLGYGNNAVEAWAMGVPVVAGTEDSRISRRMKEIIGRLPFWEASERDLYERLRAIVASENARKEAAASGIEYVREWHDGRRTVEILKGLWEAARPTRGSAHLPAAELAALHPKRKGIMAIYRNTSYPTLMVRLGDRKFKFAGGRLTVDEADAPLIDEFAVRRKEYGIVRLDPVPAKAPGAPTDSTGPTAKDLRDELRARGYSTRGGFDAMAERLREADAEVGLYDADYNSDAAIEAADAEADENDA